MKKIYFLMAMLAMTACGSNQLGIGIKSENLDPTAVPGDNFYQYACGGWIAANPLTPEYSRYGSFDALAENNREQLKGLIEEIVSSKHDASTDAGKIANLYNIYMDTTARNNQGLDFVKPYFERIEALSSNAEIIPLVAELGYDGLVGGYFDYGVGADSKDSKNNIVEVGQGGLTLGEKEYYLDTDEATANIREEFKKHIVRMFKLYGFDDAVAEAKMADVMKIETRIAQNSRSAVELRDPEANYNKMSMEQLKSDFSGIDFETLFAAYGMYDVDFVDMGQPEAIKAVEQILAEESLESQKAYLEWQLIGSTSNYLTSEVDEADFDFYGRVMRGKAEQQPMWKRATSMVSGCLGEAIGRLYVEKYFPAAAKERMEQLVKNLQIALGERIDAQDWMSDETKALAHEKLDAFYVKVGYPDTWKNYDKLVIDPEKSLAENMVEVSHFFISDMVERNYKKPVDNTRWFMTPQTVNAYYNPTTNEICFPAGILQYPFFDMNADDAFNYGAIGVVIGHEMTHGFDDMGRQFDKEGNLHDWWTEEDATKFQNRVQTLVDYFDNINVLPDLKANGSLTLGENIADHGGLMISYQAFKNATKDAPLEDVDGFTPEQRFFIAYANVWAGNIRDEEIRNRTKSDPHSLGNWRVNGTLPHIDAWYDAFGVTEENAMYIAPENRAKIW